MLFNLICLILLFHFRLAPSKAPELVVSHNSSSTTLLIKWKNLKEKHFQGKCIGYNIVYYQTDAESERKFFNVNYTTNTTTLTNLTVYTMYVINVSAVSSGGIGPANTVKARTDATGTVVFPNIISLARWLHCYVFLLKV